MRESLQNERNLCPHSYTIWQIDYRSFRTQGMVVGKWGCPLLPEILGKTDPPHHSASAKRKKVPIITNRKSTMHFAMRLRWTTYVACKPQKGADKCKMAIFWFKKCTFFAKFLCTKTVSSKVVRHSLVYLTVPLYLTSASVSLDFMALYKCCYYYYYYYYGKSWFESICQRIELRYFLFDCYRIYILDYQGVATLTILVSYSSHFAPLTKKLPIQSG